MSIQLTQDVQELKELMSALQQRVATLEAWRANMERIPLPNGSAKVTAAPNAKVIKRG